MQPINYRISSYSGSLKTFFFFYDHFFFFFKKAKLGMSISVFLDDKDTHQVTSTNWEVKRRRKEGEGNICITRIHIWTTTEQDLSTQRKVTQNRYGNLALTKQDQNLQACCDSVTMTKGSTMKHMQLSQKNIARGRDRSGASGPWITITRPSVDRICTCEGDMWVCRWREGDIVCM